jgi:PelA/Pel-15E family pectate lyase
MSRAGSHLIARLASLLLLSEGADAALQRITVASNGSHFVTISGARFVPWGFNYDHDEEGRLIEDYWLPEWRKVEQDFREMKDLAANVVRIHLQVGRFLESTNQVNAGSLRQLRRLVQLAERTGLYLDLTGLACYHKDDVPAWYDPLPEEQRWETQAAFWRAIAKECADSPAIFAYDLMNEPVAPTPDGKGTNWLGPPFAGKHFVQWIALEGKGRARSEVARAWIQKLNAAIREHDKQHLITVGLVDWSLDQPGLSSGFVPQKIVSELDFISVHLYPKKGEVDAAIDVLRQFSVGKPVLIEETFPLQCSLEEFAEFMTRSREIAAGWVGFYWGKTPEECRRSGTIADSLTLGWLEFFQKNAVGSIAAVPEGQQAATALRRGVEFFRSRVAVRGTYLWQYSDDLTRREGEGKASATRGWVQPPGTPAVGSAFLQAYDATGDSFYLEAAIETAQGLIAGQLRSGGWTYFIDFDPDERKKVAYKSGGARNGRNTTTLDDDTTQSAIRFLMRTDAALKFTNAAIHQCVLDALDSVLKAQYPNGAWPQGYDSFPDATNFPVRQASYPETWPRTWPGSQQYWRRYTLNDSALATMVSTMLEAGTIYSTNSPQVGARCRAAALRAGDFLIRAQLPEPQPAWAQQYDFDMHPCWARKFEPPSVSGGESQSALDTLLRLYQESGERKYLEPIPRALEYLRGSRLSDGRLARFYELHSNKPLYFTKNYELTYDDGDLPTHYAFKVPNRTESIAVRYARLLTNSAPKLEPPARITQKLEAEVKRIIAAQDAEGRWVEDGRLRHHGSSGNERVIQTETFVRNVETLSRYLAAKRE